MTARNRSFGSFPARLGLAADLACFALFVVLGRESHDLGGGIRWFITVFWPFGAGWLISAALLRPYSMAAGWRRVALTMVFAIAISMVLRMSLTGRGVTVSFVAVAAGFNLLFAFAWRAIATLAMRIR